METIYINLGIDMGRLVFKINMGINYFPNISYVELHEISICRLDITD